MYYVCVICGVQGGCVTIYYLPQTLSHLVGEKLASKRQMQGLNRSLFPSEAIFLGRVHD